ncbi:MAG: methylmalonyl-CoA epimerase [Propionibacteriaceae bacterium]|nr:methylmalonyl-CoA epimerase [Propionibacteriaceae bacterium]
MDDLFTCIDHVAIAYPNREDAVQFYTETMGWHLLHAEENDDQGVAEAMLSPVANPGPNDTQVQIIAPTRADATVAKWLEKNRPGLHHIAWRVDDIDAVSAALRERGVVLLYEKARHGTNNSRINFMHPKTAGGVLTEIVEPAARVTH